MKKILFNDKFCLTQEVLSGNKTMTRRSFKVPKTCNGKEVYSFNVLTNSAGTQCVDLVDEDGSVLGSWKPHYEVGDIVAIAQSYKTIYAEMIEDFAKHNYHLPREDAAEKFGLITQLPIEETFYVQPAQGVPDECVYLIMCQNGGIALNQDKVFFSHVSSNDFKKLNEFTTLTSMDIREIFN